MSNATHTPGPWGLTPAAGGDYDIGQAGDIYALACVYGDCDAIADDETLANARLIAAAPDLLATLKELIDIEGPLPGNVAWFNKAVAAVARAEGRS